MSLLGIKLKLEDWSTKNEVPVPKEEQQAEQMDVSDKDMLSMRQGATSRTLSPPGTL